MSIWVLHKDPNYLYFGDLESVFNLDVLDSSWIPIVNAPAKPKVDMKGKPCGPGQSAARSGCIPKGKGKGVVTTTPVTPSASVTPASTTKTPPTIPATPTTPTTPTPDKAVADFKDKFKDLPPEDKKAVTDKLTRASEDGDAIDPVAAKKILDDHTGGVSKGKAEEPKKGAGKPCGPGQSAARTGCVPKGKAPTKPQKAAADKATKDKADKDKADADKAKLDKADSDKATADKATKDKAEADKAKAAKDAADKAKADSDKATADKAKKDKEDADKAVADKAKAAKDKTDKDELDRQIKAKADKDESDKAQAAKDARTKASTPTNPKVQADREAVVRVKATLATMSPEDKAEVMTRLRKEPNGSKGTVAEGVIEQYQAEKYAKARQASIEKDAGNTLPANVKEVVDLNKKYDQATVVHRAVRDVDTSKMSPSQKSEQEAKESKAKGDRKKAKDALEAAGAKLNDVEFRMLKGVLVAMGSQDAQFSIDVISKQMEGMKDIDDHVKNIAAGYEGRIFKSDTRAYKQKVEDLKTKYINATDPYTKQQYLSAGRKAQQDYEAAADRRGPDRDHMFKILSGDGGATANIKDSSGNSTISKRMNEAMDFYKKVGAGQNLGNIEVRNADDPDTGRNGRAALRPGSGGNHQLFVAPDTTVQVHVHELGHALEISDPGNLAASKAFVEKRCGSESYKDMADATGVEAMRGEKGRKDNFDKALGNTQGYYAGKDYGGAATEIMSLGLEQLHRDPVGFCQSDPEYAKFVIAMLKGKFKKRG